MPIAEGALHPLIAVWKGKADAASREYNDAPVAPSPRKAYLAGRIDAFSECADALEEAIRRSGRPR